MRAIVGFFRQGWVISLLGLIAIAALIWYAGPLFAFAGKAPLETEEARFWAIGVVTALWTLNRLRAFFLALRNNSQMLSGILQQAKSEPSATESASAEELATLSQRLEEAIGTLKSSRLGGGSGRRFLYQLPWYIIVGPPGAGKTTALINSGLKFPLEDQFGNDRIRGVGGTRNCDWWFTDEAVLIDTAGRYTTQDSHEEVDRAAWTGFLDLLKKHRRRRPINGALIAISISDLMQQSEAERAAHARAVKQRIQELHEHLGVRFPIYVLFTKCDLLAGFVEFFADLSRDQLEQVWGMTFPLDAMDKPEGVVAGFGMEFAALERRLNDRLVERLQQERDPQKRDLIFGFPKQFSALKSRAERFLGDVFQPSRFLDKPMLRGIYFTSGTQEGTPVDRLMGILASSFGLERESLPSFSGTGKSFFITRLFRDVIFAEAGLAGTNLKLERKRAWLQRGAYVGALGLVALAAAAWLTSYTQNRGYISDVAERARSSREVVTGADVKRGDLLAVLPSLDAVRGIPQGYDDEERSTPWLMGLGLYQGDKLGSAATRSYQRLLSSLFHPTLMLRLEKQMGGGKVTYDYLYGTLKVYLMLIDAERFEPETVRAWFVNDWDTNLPREVTAEQREALRRHLDAVLAHPPDQPALAPHGTLVANTRKALTQVPLAKRAYAQLNRASQEWNIPDFNIINAAGDDAPLVFKRASGKSMNSGIPGLYTYRGYFQGFLANIHAITKQVAGESWVLGTDDKTTDEKAQAKLTADVQKLYLDDYVREWNTLLNDIEVVGFTNLSQSVEVLNILAGTPSPLRLLLEGVARETALDSPPGQVASFAQRAETKVMKTVESIIGGSDGQSVVPSPQLPKNDVATRFKGIHREVRARGESPPPIDGTMASIDDLFRAMHSVARAADRQDLVKVAQEKAETQLERLEFESRRKPSPLKEWMRQLAAQSHALVGVRVTQTLNSAWVDSVLKFCRGAIMHRYPLERGSQKEIAIDDFSRFFGPNGIMEAFFKERLSEFVDTSRRPWRVRSSGGVTLQISSEGLKTFQQAAVIRETFFSAGGDKPSLTFVLKPIRMDADITNFVLDIEGQTLTYRHGPVRPHKLTWPGSPDSAQEVRIQLSLQSEGGRSSWTEEGAWAWFRMLDKAQVSPDKTPEKFRVTFDLGGRDVVFELSATSASNPFRLKELEQFQCPASL